MPRPSLIIKHSQPRFKNCKTRLHTYDQKPFRLRADLFMYSFLLSPAVFLDLPSKSRSNLLLSMFRWRVALTYSHCMAHFLRYYDSAQIVDSSYDTRRFHIYNKHPFKKVVIQFLRLLSAAKLNFFSPRLPIDGHSKSKN